MIQLGQAITRLNRTVLCKEYFNTVYSNTLFPYNIYFFIIVPLRTFSNELSLLIEPLLTNITPYQIKPYVQLLNANSAGEIK